MNCTALTRRRARGLTMLAALVLPLSGCEQKPSSGGAVVRADLSATPATKPSEKRAIVRGTASPAADALIAQARAQPESQPSASPQRAMPEAKPALPKAPPSAGKPSTATRPVSDAVLATRVKSAVLAQPLSALMFNVNVSNGVVTLSGTADTADTREKAGRAAADVEGVRSVNNRISVLSGS